MTMGHVEDASAVYMRCNLAEMLLKAGQIYLPEKGAGTLSDALASRAAMPFAFQHPSAAWSSGTAPWQA